MNNILIVEHDRAPGNYKFFGRIARFTPGRIEFQDSRIAKKIARHTSEDYGRCEIRWESRTHIGTALYERGEKVRETFNKKNPN